jgi:glycosyltransferase involved in cell wall biosynthesis
MIQTKLLRISIVIPVYNEAEALGACLLSISRQLVAPYEVIVVDNNSTDETAAVVRSFSFVRVMTELKQGVVHARNTGFNAARGEIIGRLDADTILDPNWTVQVTRIMADRTIAAVSGSISYHDLPWRATASRLELFFRQRIANGMGSEVFLQGANMALRRSSWLNVRAQTCTSKGLHEDFDLAVHLHDLQDQQQRVVFDPSLHANLSLRRFDSSYISFVPYALQNPKTYAVHGRTAQRHMYPAIALVLLFYVPIKLLYRGYDPYTERFSLAKLFAVVTNVRVNPATFVD